MKRSLKQDYEDSLEKLISRIINKLMAKESIREIIQFICDSLVQLFNLRLVWIGFKESDYTVTIKAYSGDASGYLKDFSVSWDTGSSGFGPAGRTLRSGFSRVYIFEDELLGPWREKGAIYGFATLASIPICVQGDSIAVIHLYSSQRDTFSSTLIKKMEWYARIVGMTLNMASYYNQLGMLAKVLESSDRATLMVDRHGKIRWTNSAFGKLTGYAWTEVLGHHLQILSSGLYDQSYFKESLVLINEEDIWRGEIFIRRKDLRLERVRITITQIQDENTGTNNYIIEFNDTKRVAKNREVLERYKTLFQAINDIIIVTNEQQKIIEINDAAIEMYGYSRTEFLTLNAKDICTESYFPDDNPTPKGCDKGLIETSHRHKDGSLLFVEARVHAIKCDLGFEYLSVIREVTERKLNEIIDGIIQAVIRKLILKEPYQTIIDYACQGLYHAFDYGLVQLTQIVDDSIKVIAYAGDRWEDSSEGLGLTWKAFRTGKVQVLEMSHAKGPGIKSRSGFRSEMFFPLLVRGKILGTLNLYSFKPHIKNENLVKIFGRLADQLAIVIDTALTSQMVELLTKAWESAPNGVIIFDQDGCIFWVNKVIEQLSGYNSKELVGMNASNLSGSLWIKREINKEILEGKTWVGESMIKRKDGNSCSIELTISSVFDGVEDYKFICMIKSIPRRRSGEVEVALARVENARFGQLEGINMITASITHEINQPLNSIKVTADSILYWSKKGTPLDSSKVFEKVQRISQQATRIDIITKQMQSFIRKDIQSRLTFCDLNEAIKSTFAMLGETYSECDITFRLQLLDSLPMIKANRTGLEQIIYNLFTNAIQALEGCNNSINQVICRTWFEDGVFCEVNDNGPGMSLQLVDRLFEPYFTTRSKQGGNGLGLTIVKTIVQSFGGSIEVLTREQGGTSFILKFPVFNPKGP